MTADEKDKPREPLVGYVVIDEYEDGMGNWDGVIAYPNPRGATLFWENPQPFIEKSAYDELQAQVAKLKEENERLREKLERVVSVLKNHEDIDRNGHPNLAMQILAELETKGEK